MRDCRLTRASCLCRRRDALNRCILNRHGERMVLDKARVESSRRRSMAGRVDSAPLLGPCLAPNVSQGMSTTSRGYLTTNTMNLVFSLGSRSDNGSPGRFFAHPKAHSFRDTRRSMSAFSCRLHCMLPQEASLTLTTHLGRGHGPSSSRRQTAS